MATTKALPNFKTSNGIAFGYYYDGYEFVDLSSYFHENTTSSRASVKPATTDTVDPWVKIRTDSILTKFKTNNSTINDALSRLIQPGTLPQFTDLLCSYVGSYSPWNTTDLIDTYISLHATYNNELEIYQSTDRGITWTLSKKLRSSDFKDKTLPTRLICIFQGAGGGGSTGDSDRGGAGGGGGSCCTCILNIEHIYNSPRGAQNCITFILGAGGKPGVWADNESARSGGQANRSSIKFYINGNAKNIFYESMAASGGSWWNGSYGQGGATSTWACGDWSKVWSLYKTENLAVIYALDGARGGDGGNNDGKLPSSGSGVLSTTLYCSNWANNKRGDNKKILDYKWGGVHGGNDKNYGAGGGASAFGYGGDGADASSGDAGQVGAGGGGAKNRGVGGEGGPSKLWLYY